MLSSSDTTILALHFFLGSYILLWQTNILRECKLCNWHRETRRCMPAAQWRTLRRLSRFSCFSRGTSPHKPGRDHALLTKCMFTCARYFLLNLVHEGHAGCLVPGALFIGIFFANAHKLSSSWNCSAVKSLLIMLYMYRLYPVCMFMINQAASTSNVPLTCATGVRPLARVQSLWYTSWHLRWLGLLHWSYTFAMRHALAEGSNIILTTWGS